MGEFERPDPPVPPLHESEIVRGLLEFVAEIDGRGGMVADGSVPARIVEVEGRPDDDTAFPRRAAERV